ncbi:uncharacterized protein A4U43_C01F19740 [Asparagus officinalis]|uniref:Uncharacterized protein n=1 Tax=Asparagus officinalis TaxID=4686 RepID=A0A5P1FT56_ASPOF|nr:uncharacterized protein A4U43_C01F19740 [Asparagus officinalis]
MRAGCEHLATGSDWRAREDISMGYGCCLGVIREFSGVCCQSACSDGVASAGVFAACWCQGKPVSATSLEQASKSNQKLKFLGHGIKDSETKQTGEKDNLLWINK